jgi:fluoride exporter
MVQALSPQRRMMAVLIGGFLGTISRFLLSQLIQSLLGKSWPFDIFTINITGAFALAFVNVLADATILIGPTRRLFITVGFLGAYTTFSSLSLNVVQLLEAGQWFPGLLFLVVSLDEGYFAVLLGDWLGHQFCTFIRQLNPSLLPPTQEPLIKTLKTQTMNSVYTKEAVKLAQLLLDRPSLAGLIADIRQDLRSTSSRRVLPDTDKQKQVQEALVTRLKAQARNSSNAKEAIKLAQPLPNRQNFAAPISDFGSGGVDGPSAISDFGLGAVASPTVLPDTGKQRQFRRPYVKEPIAQTANSPSTKAGEKLPNHARWIGRKYSL